MEETHKANITKIVKAIKVLLQNYVQDTNEREYYINTLDETFNYDNFDKQTDKICSFFGELYYVLPEEELMLVAIKLINYKNKPINRVIIRNNDLNNNNIINDLEIKLGGLVGGKIYVFNESYYLAIQPDIRNVNIFKYLHLYLTKIIKEWEELHSTTCELLLYGEQILNLFNEANYLLGMNIRIKKNEAVYNEIYYLFKNKSAYIPANVWGKYIVLPDIVPINAIDHLNMVYKKLEEQNLIKKGQIGIRELTKFDELFPGGNSIYFFNALESIIGLK